MEFLFAFFYAFFPISLPLSSISLCLIIILALKNYKEYNNNEVRKLDFISLNLCALYALVIIGIIYSNSDWKWISLHLEKYSKFLIAVILIIFLKNNEKLQSISLKAFIASMIFILASTWINIWYVLPWSKTKEIGWGKSHHVFGDYITQNLMMAFFVSIGLYYSYISKKIEEKTLWIIITALSIISITHLSEGRTGLLALSASLLSTIIILTKRKWIVATLLLTIISAGFVFNTSTIIKNRFNQAIEEAQRHNEDKISSIGHRLYNYKTTIELIKEKPIWGHGTGGFHTEICKFLTPQEECDSYNWHPHNQFLLFGSDYGFIGIILYSTFIFSLYLTAYKSSELKLKILLGSFASILLIDSFFNSPLFSGRESHFFMYITALLVSMDHYKKFNLK